jgi:hypothetical protein
MFYQELVDDPPKALMKEMEPDVYSWLLETQPSTQFGVSAILLDPYSILTLSFSDETDLAMYRLTFADVFVNPSRIPKNIIDRYF